MVSENREKENKETDMIYFVVCEKCGQIDNAPNGSMMEASARIHAEKCGNNVVIGPKYKPNREFIRRFEWDGIRKG